MFASGEAAGCALASKPACHPDRPLRALGLCAPCYLSRPALAGDRRAECHTDRVHFARGQCHNCYMRAYQREHDTAERRARWAKSVRLRRMLRKSVEWGLGPDEFWQRVERGCTICGAVFDESAWGGPRFDHNHATGGFRGLLCHGCNTSIGHLKDNPALIRRAAAYVEANGIL